MISFKIIPHSFTILYFVFKYFIHLELILTLRMSQRSSFIFLICLLKNPFSICQSILPTDLKWHFYYKLHSHILISISWLSIYSIDQVTYSYSSVGALLLSVILHNALSTWQGKSCYSPSFLPRIFLALLLCLFSSSCWNSH